MTKVAILPIFTGKGDISYRAVAKNKQSHGNTAGEALDALTTQLPEDEAGFLVVIQSLRPDRFFNAAQQQRLADLMENWRLARDREETLTPEEQAELNALVEAELCASGDRASAFSLSALTPR